MHYLDREAAEKAAQECYPEIRDFTCDILWDGLPKDVQERLMDEEASTVSELDSSFDSLHDNKILRYCADFEARTLHMETQSYSGEKLSIHFSGFLAHWFENVMLDNIILDLDEYAADDFLEHYKDILYEKICYGFPECCTIEEMRERMERERIRVFVINSAQGLCGFVLAQSAAIGSIL